MTYDLAAHRETVRCWHLEMAASPLMADHAEHQARQLVKEDPTLHGDLLEAVQAAMPARRGQQNPNAPRRTTTRRA